MLLALGLIHTSILQHMPMGGPRLPTRDAEEFCASPCSQSHWCHLECSCCMDIAAAPNLTSVCVHSPEHTTVCEALTVHQWRFHRLRIPSNHLFQNIGIVRMRNYLKMANGLGERQFTVNIPMYTRVYFYKYTTILQNSQGGSVQSLGILSYVLWGETHLPNLLTLQCFLQLGKYTSSGSSCKKCQVQSWFYYILIWIACRHWLMQWWSYKNEWMQCFWSADQSAVLTVCCAIVLRHAKDHAV